MLWIQRLVSDNRRRLVDQDGQVDLDLSYITDRIIAMSHPSDGFEGVYRNPFSKVKSYLDSHHQGQYKVYSLRSEKVYDATRFNAPVAEYGFDDHQAPPLALLINFCKDAAQWLATDGHVVAIHCKAGKGRTGTVISCLLLYLGLAKDAQEAMAIYGTRRTLDGKGVTIPSQRRYVKYFEHLINAGPELSMPSKQWVTIVSLKIHNGPKEYQSSPAIPFEISNHSKRIYTQRNTQCKFENDSTVPTIHTLGIEPIEGDFKITFFSRNFFAKPLFSFWLHSAFFDRKQPCIQLLKHEIDIAFADHKCRCFPKDFRVEMNVDVK